MIRRSNLTFSSAHFENTNRKHVADSSSISRNFKRRGTQNAHTNEIQRERERESYARIDSPSFARETDCWIWCSSFRFTNVAAITARSRSTTREMGTRTDPSYTTSCFFLLAPRIFARGNCFSSLRS